MQREQSFLFLNESEKHQKCFMEQGRLCACWCLQVMARGALRAPASVLHQLTAVMAAQQQRQAHHLAQAARWGKFLSGVETCDIN
jgi:hypothetical protein